MKKFFKTLNDSHQILFLNACVIIAAAVFFLPFCFFSLNSALMFGILYGWLLGGAISCAAFAMLINQINSLASSDERVKVRVMGLHILRLSLYALGLIVSGYLWSINKPFINLFAVFAGYLPIRVIIYLYKRKANVSK